MSDDGIDITWNITMLGPTRVGKTSLVAALYRAGQDYFAGKPISVKADAFTSALLLANDRQMRGELAQGRFSPGTLRGSTESETSILEVSPIHTGSDDDGASTFQLELVFHDFPGGWLLDPPPAWRLDPQKAAEYKNAIEQKKTYQKALAESQCVIIPIDATVLMEVDSTHYLYIQELLRVGEVAEFVREWAKTRKLQGDATRLILAPVKCESYFDDNGGRADRSAELFGQVKWLYGEIVKTYQAEIGKDQAGEVLYAPVDTIGPIYFTKADWGEEVDGQWVETESGTQMRANFAVRSNPEGLPAERHIHGAEPILATLVNDAVTETRHRINQQLSYERDQKQAIESEKRQHERNVFTHLFYIITGSKKNDAKRLAQISKQMKALRSDLNNIRTTRESLSGEYNRVKEWFH